MEFIIDRNTWRCGGVSSDSNNRLGLGQTYLENKEGSQCCIGQICHQLPEYRGVNLISIITPLSITKETNFLVIVSIDKNLDKVY
ncbi:hypothetical protein, partial [Lactobacillus acidophilus]|uniref:hypothetical protein n=1 Tax=Lactobacillus acidophilus TaxID=1579 RepID=UPI0021CB7784